MGRSRSYESHIDEIHLFFATLELSFQLPAAQTTLEEETSKDPANRRHVRAFALRK